MSFQGCLNFLFITDAKIPRQFNISSVSGRTKQKECSLGRPDTQLALTVNNSAFSSLQAAAACPFQFEFCIERAKQKNCAIQHVTATLLRIGELPPDVGGRYIRSSDAHLQFMSLPGINPERTTLKVGKRLCHLTDTM